jgi:Ni/Fe-hydrogenase subunit HybB-like protein
MTVYLFGLRQYHSLVRLAILTGFLGYLFAVIFLLLDLGRPWRLPYPMFVAFGTTSVLFLVAWHVALYLSVQFIEFCTAIFEWLDFKTLRRYAERLTIGATIFGVILSTLHQSALGAMFLLAPGKLHPLWYSPFIPVFFFVSSIAGGISVVIVASILCSRFLPHRADHHFTKNLDELTLGLGKAASLVLITYFALKWIGVAHGNHWNLLNSSWGYWFLLEIFIFVLLPCFLYAFGVRDNNVGLVRFTGFLTIIGILFNRITVSLIAFNWNLPHREIPHWKEFIIVFTILTISILTFRWIVNRMPVLREHPEYAG